MTEPLNCFTAVLIRYSFLAFSGTILTKQQQQRHNRQLISCERRIIRGLWTFPFHLPQLHSAKIRFKWLWEEDEREVGWRWSSRRQLCTSLCGLNNTERQDSAEQKRNRKRPMESSFQQPHVALVLPDTSNHPHDTQVSLPCSAANQEKGHSCHRGSQVGNALFSTRCSQLRVDKDCKAVGLICFLTSGTAQKLCRRDVGLVKLRERRLWVRKRFGF